MQRFVGRFVGMSSLLVGVDSISLLETPEDGEILQIPDDFEEYERQIFLEDSAQTRRVHTVTVDEAGAAQEGTPTASAAADGTKSPSHAELHAQHASEVEDLLNAAKELQDHPALQNPVAGAAENAAIKEAQKAADEAGIARPGMKLDNGEPCDDAASTKTTTSTEAPTSACDEPKVNHTAPSHPREDKDEEKDEEEMNNRAKNMTGLNDSGLSNATNDTLNCTDSGAVHGSGGGPLLASALAGLVGLLYVLI